MKDGSAQNQAYAQFVARFMLADFPGAQKAWQAVGREPHSLTETGMLAWCYAALGNEIECEKLLARHGPVLPAETHLIRGLLLKTLERPAEAAAQWRDGFVKLRAEPWALNEYAVLTVLEATKLQNDHPKLASVVLEGLSEPFASGFLDRQRRLAACVVAATLSPAEAVPYFESFEPHVPWDASFLSERAKIYSAAGHALAGQAERDLRRFQSQQ